MIGELVIFILQIFLYQAQIEQYKYCIQGTIQNNICSCEAEDLQFDISLKYCICKTGDFYNENTKKCQYCTELYTNCSTCDTNECISCIGSGFNKLASGCFCDGFIEQNQCNQCTLKYSNCSQCNKTNCTQCSFGYILNTLKTTCINCTSITSNCAQCTETQCQSCLNGFSLSNSQCQCDISQNYFTIKQNNCEECQLIIEGCSKCNTDQNILKCLICTDPYIITSDFNCKTCTIGQYRLDGKCINCTDPFCGKCDQNKCFECLNTFQMLNSICQCDKEVIDQVNLICTTCQNLYGALCKTCNSSVCQTCALPYYNASQKGCECLNGNVLQDGTCQMCPLNCTGCDLNKVCSSCVDGYQLFVDNNCKQCLVKQYFTNLTQGCINCQPNCLNCLDNSGICTGPCDNGFVFENGSCICPLEIKFIYNAACLFCNNMVSHCKTCTQTQCILCEEPYNILFTNQCVQCEQGQYYSSVTESCINCKYCTKCHDQTGFCLAQEYCFPSFYLDFSGFCNCLNTHVILPNTNSCVLCSLKYTDCQICDNTICLLCNPNKHLMQDQTQCLQCSTLEYYTSDTKKCNQCPNNCTKCSIESGFCTGECLNNYILIQGQCLCSSDRALQQNKCLSCSELVSNCIECNSQFKCTKCVKSKQVYLGGCRDCFADELMVDGNCIACNVMMGRCIACKSNSKCEVCLSSFRKANDGFKDYCECPEGSFIIPRTAKTEEICQKCNAFDANCIYCLQQNICSWCIMDFYFNIEASKCTQCNSDQYYTTTFPEKVNQNCINCSKIHQKCITCDRQAQCNQCKDNYANRNNTCVCQLDRFLFTNNENKEEKCELCRIKIDKNCLECDSENLCTKCEQFYYWSKYHLRCLPEIIISFDFLEGKPLQTIFKMNTKIAKSYLNSQVLINIYLYGSKADYLSEINGNKLKLESDFQLKKNYLVLSEQINASSSNYDVKKNSEYMFRQDQFLLHEGDQYIVYTVVSKNGKFVEFSDKIQLKVQEYNSSLKDIVYDIYQFYKSLNKFNLYQVFKQILIKNRQICAQNSTCSNNGKCLFLENKCDCFEDFTLFDCSGLQTDLYDKIIQEIYAVLSVKNPLSYAEKEVQINLPQLITQNTVLSLENIKQNIQRIYEIIRSEYVDEDEFADAEIMILNIVVCIGKALKEPNIFMSKSDIFAYLKIINDIIKEILDRQIKKTLTFVTNQIQLLSFESRDPDLAVLKFVQKDNFNPKNDVSNYLFQPSEYDSIGRKLRVQQLAYQENPYRYTNQSLFENQRYLFPFVQYKVWDYNYDFSKQRTSTPIKTQYQSPLNSVEETITEFALKYQFVFEVEEPQELINPICLSLNGYESSQFHMCEDFVILEKEIVCNCFNSAVLYEDIGNIFVAKKEEFVDNSDSVESEYTLKSLIIVLSVFIFILLCLHWGQFKKKDDEDEFMDGIDSLDNLAIDDRNLKIMNKQLSSDFNIQMATSIYSNPTQNVNSSENSPVKLNKSPNLRVQKLVSNKLLFQKQISFGNSNNNSSNNINISNNNNNSNNNINNISSHFADQAFSSFKIQKQLTQDVQSSQILTQYTNKSIKDTQIVNNEGNICSINDEVIEEEKGKKNNIRDKMKNIESFFKHQNNLNKNNKKPANSPKIQSSIFSIFKVKEENKATKSQEEFKL